MLTVQQIAQRIRRQPRLYTIGRAALVRTRRAMAPRTVPGVPGRIHRNDLMYAPGVPDAAEAYDRIGRSAVQRCAEVLAEVGRSWADVRSAADFGCGHGRVARQLAAVLQAGGGKLTVCDLDPEAVRFCASEFSARGITSARDLSQVDLGLHDLIWAGSVATHLPEQTWLEWIELVSRSLTPGGLFVFTSHGPDCIDADFQVEWIEHRERLRADLDRTGYAYVGYSYLPEAEYGLTAQTTTRIDRDLAAVGMRRVLHRPAGWEYQDVHGFVL